MKLKNNILKKTIFSVIFLFLIIGLFGAVKLSPVFAGIGDWVEVGDTQLKLSIEAEAKKTALEKKWYEKMTEAGKKALSKAVGNALKTIAYDTATWVGSGGSGQKPMFITENWNMYLNNIADNAAGTFLEELGKNGFAKFNLCEPSLDIKIKIGLGLTQYARPTAPACSFSKMTQSWTSAAIKFKDMKREDYLKATQDMFDPGGSDLSSSFSLQTGIIEEQSIKASTKNMERTSKGGWLDVTNLAGAAKSSPGEAESRIGQARDKLSGWLSSKDPETLSGILVESANIFLNQLAITSFNKLMADIGKDLSNTTSSYGDMGALFSKEAAPSTAGIAGITGAIATLQNAKVDFTTRADYDILSELAACPDPTKAGPTNCVITDKFVQAVSEKKTVSEAIKAGYLNSVGSFGFNDGYEPKYMDEAYPYRSLIILRKYRILPVGWELAGQYIKNEQSKTGYVDGDFNFNLGQLVACFNPLDEYTGYNDNDSASENWCEGLIDPNWVLKAPTNYCKRQGFGPEIVSQSVVGTGLDSYVGIARNENYCADEQSCIKENNDGSCAAFGYCSKERRKWDFGSKSCDAKYNTCQTFKTSEGQSISYLENTLDYSGCSADNAGCKAYAVKAADYDTGSSSVVWSETNPVHLDRDAETCDATNEGCHEFIRIKTGSGANLIANSSFEDDLAGTFGEGQTAEATDAYSGTKSLKLSSGGLSKSVLVAPYDYGIGSERFTLSFYAKNCGTDGTFGIGGVTNSLDTDVSSWTRQVFTYIYPSNITGNEVDIAIAPSVTGCLIDAIKLERNSQATAYSDYGAEGVVYEKLLPAYLSDLSGSNLCYNNDGSAKSDAPDECANFVRKCTVDEVNCDMYTSATDGVEVPAKVTVNDYCQAECVGYDTYVQNATTFDTQGSEYFIPSSAKVCGAEAAGCEEFTNLDQLEKGGEAIEHYSYLRQCIKPDTAACAEFYAWEGSDESGFQLKVMQLKNDVNKPASTNSDATEEANTCNETIYNLASTDPSYNSDCRQFYNKAGVISYRLMTHTISCSDDCFAYRMARINIDESITAAADCAGDDKHWDSATNQCAVCENGGKWKTDLGACVYEAVPAEGTVCAAVDNGCREYGGNAGNNMLVVMNNSFEGSSEGWTSVSSVTGSTAIVDNNSLTVGGQSLAVSNAAEVVLGQLMQKDKSYVLSFIAKGSALNVSLSASIADQSQTDPAKISAFTGVAALSSSEWKRFELNLPKLDHEVTANETLFIFGAGSFYIDDIKLTEITDRYYLIQDSWVTPDACNEDANGDPYPLFALGCDAYSDRDNNTHYLHSFSHLCQDSAVGCELMIDTQNTIDYKEKEYANTPTVTITEDVFDYVVFDKEKQCSAIDKGCQRLGKPYKYEQTSLYSDVYLKNDPDKYSTILCGSEAAECSEWATNDGNVYFRDPGAQTCEWRQSADTGASGGWKWYKTKIKKCSGGTNSGKVCSKDGDCPESTCVKETGDNLCAASALKTFGEGGSETYQPTSDDNGHWAGICPASESSCTEYIDPVSESGNDLAVNSSVKLLTNTLYIIDSGTINSSGNNCKDDKDAVLSPSNIFYFLNSDNTLATPSWSSMSVAGNGSQFYVGKYGTSAYITCPATAASVRQAAVDYQLKDEVDTETCNGNVDFETGCVLFNERAQNGASGLAGLDYDAFLTLDDLLGKSPTAGTANNSNQLLKVTPDRECAEWIGCAESNTSGVCTELGLCNKLDDSNTSCERFITPAAASNQTYPGITIDNMSGYAKAAYYNININDPIHPYPDDYYQFEKMVSVGAITNVSNGGFELNEVSSATTTDYDLRVFFPTDGWECASGVEEDDCHANVNVLNNPVSIQTDQVCFRTDGSGNCTAYAPEGNSILKVTAPYGVVYDVQAQTGDLVSALPFSTKATTNDTENFFIVTGYINTSKMSMGKVVVKVTELQYVNTDAEDLSTYTDTKAGPDEIASLEKGQDWTFFFHKICGKQTGSGAADCDSNMDPDTTHLRITLTTEGDTLGSYYFDDIKIRPILVSRSGFSNQQTCRLYPQENSLTCDYEDASGVRYKGLYGYCLEYDRFPGSADTCLQWWPVPNKNNNSDNANELSEICNDGQASGNEDCDCKQIVGENSITYCNTEDGFGYGPLGTNKENQYACSACRWTDGYCGDGLVEAGYSETCDWNKGDTTDPDLGTATNCMSNHPDFAHTDAGITYNNYLYGVDGADKIGCYNNEGTNSDSTRGDGTPGVRCRLDRSNCSDDLYNGDHSRADCIAAGGVVVNKKGEDVTDSEGNITGSVGQANKDYFCKFSKVSFTGGKDKKADLDDLCVSNGGAGWKSYNNWTTTSAAYCESHSSDSSCDEADCTTVEHTNFASTGQESCYCKDLSWDYLKGCTSYDHYGYANISAVGCY